MIPLLILAFGVAAAAASIAIAVRLLPPARGPLSRPFASREAVLLEEARWRAERETKEEIDALRQVMLQQRLELMQLRRREERREDPRSRELALRSRRAANEAQLFSEQPVVALSAGHLEFS